MRILKTAGFKFLCALFKEHFGDVSLVKNFKY